MEPEEIEGTDPQQLEDAATAIEGLIAAALAAVAVQAATSMVVVPGVPAVDVNVLGSIPQWWEQRLRRRIMPALRRTVDTVTRRLRGLFDDELERLGETEVLYTGTGTPELFPADDVSPVLPLPDITAEDILAQARNRLVAIGDDLWVNARTSLVEGMQQGESVPQLAARVRAAAGVTEPRARVIARTEVISASNASSIAQARSTGIGLDKIWIATEDDRTRLWHREADGQTVPIDEPFIVGGEALDFPGDPTGSAANVINERCSIGYRVALAPDGGITTAAVPHLHTCQEGPRPWKPGPCKGWKHDLPETDPRWKPRPEPKPARKPRAKKAVTPDTPAEPDVADTVIKQRQARQKTIDQARSRAGVLAELEQLALMEGASPRLYTQRLNARIRKDGLGEDPVVAAVADAVRTGDTQQIMAAIEEAARKAGLERIGGAPGNPDQVMPFDRTVHRPTGGDIPDGAPAQLVRPGYRYRMAGEGNLLLEKATVEPVGASIVVAAAVPHLHTCREGPRPWKPGPCKGAKRKIAAPALSPVAAPVKPRSAAPVASKPEAVLRPAGEKAAFQKRVKAAKANGDVRDSLPYADRLEFDRLKFPKGFSGKTIVPALDHYKRLGYRPMNQDLREGRAENYAGGPISQMRAAMSVSKTGRDGVAYRGIAAPEKVFGDAWNPDGDNSGLEWVDRGFASTSTSERYAKAFAEDALMRVLVPAGTPAVSMMATYRQGSDPEQELVLSDGLKYKIISDSGPGRRPRRIDVEVVSSD